MNKSRGPVGKTAVVGVKDRDSGEVRAEVVQRTDGATLKGFVREHVEPGSTVYTDDAAAYKGMPEFDHEAVNHSVSECVGAWRIPTASSPSGPCSSAAVPQDQPEASQRYDLRSPASARLRTQAQMRDTVAGLVGRNHRDLIADNGLSSGSASRHDAAEKGSRGGRAWGQRRSGLPARHRLCGCDSCPFSGKGPAASTFPQSTTIHSKWYGSFTPCLSARRPRLSERREFIVKERSVAFVPSTYSSHL